MQTGTGAKTLGENAVMSADNLETWSCGCTTVGSATALNARCITCDGVFEKVAKKKLSSIKKGKSDTVKMGLVNSSQTLFPEPEAVETIVCQQCDSSGQVKVFTQEWDMIKSHQAPCPMCFSQEWLNWSAGKRIVMEK